MAVDYPQLLEDSVLKLSNLIKQRRKLDRDIARLERFITSTARATQVTLPITRASAAPTFDISSIGFTEAIRRVLDIYRIWLTPVLIRDLLPTVGFSTNRYKHPLPSIHVTLNRLALGGEIICRSRPNGHVAYLWAAAFKDSEEMQNRLLTEERYLEGLCQDAAYLEPK